MCCVCVSHACACVVVCVCVSIACVGALGYVRIEGVGGIKMHVRCAI
jgi:hypothetical protein